MNGSKDELLTLGMESSCDDTGVALLRGQRTVVAELLASQIGDHAPFGGVIPEYAARKHLEAFLPLVESLFGEAGIHAPGEQIGLIAVTAGPGLIGSLAVGVTAAQALALAWNKPIVGVHHLEGHLFANIVSHPDLQPPFLCLIVSGGHTEIVLVRDLGQYEFLGGTRDDAAGEAYDKVAKELGLGYPGGPIVDRLAASGDPRAHDFPVPMKGRPEISFSFSGLKTAVVTEIHRQRAMGAGVQVEHLCASFQRAVVGSLMDRVDLAVRKTGVRTVALSGGVGANSALRKALQGQKNWRVYLPPLNRCTDNAVMIAAAGYSAYRRQGPAGTIVADPSWQLW
ncbi:MAG TPA: tRNA (adenosine(37)-N6)-threonylcarbamoyltransferase complex transferase subunit TsaD [Synergistaceae bacterium]|nr:tRNA (adenosine(37)-N6)-threonylcarbamoyltransferase complex transferase subunit TsaD [Synergistaceae bacterium]